MTLIVLVIVLSPLVLGGFWIRRNVPEIHVGVNRLEFSSSLTEFLAHGTDGAGVFIRVQGEPTSLQWEVQTTNGRRRIVLIYQKAGWAASHYEKVIALAEQRGLKWTDDTQRRRRPVTEIEFDQDVVAAWNFTVSVFDQVYLVALDNCNTTFIPRMPKQARISSSKQTTST